MIIPFEKILEKLPEKPKRVVHIGGYLGEEKAIYDKHGINSFFVECHPDLYKQLANNVGAENCCNYAVSSNDFRKTTFYKVESFDRTNRGCGSLLRPGGILKNPYLEQLEMTEVVTITLDTLNELFGPFDFFNCDAQGNELNILRHGHDFLSNPELKGLFMEFTTVSLYEGDCLLPELDEFLAKYDFQRVITEFATSEWGDALWIKEESDPDMVYGVHKSQR